MPQSWIKDPSEDLDYGIDWDKNDWLSSVSDTISSSTWAVDSGITVGTDAKAPSNTTTTTTLWLSGGTAGNTYKAVNTIVTAGGRTGQRTLTIYVKQR
jgi:hypothetical protein